MSAKSSSPNVLAGLLRVTIPGIALVALVSVGSVLTIRYFHHRAVLRDYLAQSKSEIGVAAVKAIYEYRLAHGMWPMELSEIVPLQLRHLPPQDWKLIWNGYGGEVGPVLQRSGGPQQMVVQYQFPVADEASPAVGWSATSGGSSISIDPSQELPAPSEYPAAEVEQRRIAAMKQRMISHHYDERHAAEYARLMAEKPQ